MKDAGRGWLIARVGVATALGAASVGMKRRSLVPPLAPPFERGGFQLEEHNNGFLKSKSSYAVGGSGWVACTSATTRGDQLGGSHLFTGKRFESRQQRARRHLH